MIYTGFRSDTKDLFKVSDIMDPRPRKDSEIMAVRETGEIEMLKSSQAIMMEDPETEILFRWVGKFRSDTFVFKAKEFQNIKQE